MTPAALEHPSPPLQDGVIRLLPLTQDDAGPLQALTGDPDVARFTLVPSDPGPSFAAEWIARYERGWRDGDRAGFSLRDSATDAFQGFASVVRLDLQAREGELGYIVAPDRRGRGLALRAVDLLTRWCFGVLALRRLELRIDPLNAPSVRVAERAGYRLDGTLRDVHIKEGRRGDLQIWSRLASD